MTSLKKEALSIWHASVDAVRARSLVSGCVSVTEDGLQICLGRDAWKRERFKRMVVVGAGKAGTAMTEGLLDSVADWLPTTGWVNVPAGTEKSLGSIKLHAARPAGVNEPKAQGVEGTNEILKLVQEAGPESLCIALISGGGSALLPAPADGISLADKQSVIRHLSATGANIAELNTVRKHLSKVKGGGLAAECNAGNLITLVLSDVLGDPLDLIASGPTVPDTSTPQEAIEILRRFDPDGVLPRHLVTVLEQSVPKKIDCESHVFVIGNNQVAVDAAVTQGQSMGFKCSSTSATDCEGDAEEIGEDLANQVIALVRDPDLSQPVCIVSGGEPTVQLAPESVRGKGGRNQQLILAAYQRLLKSNLTQAEWSRLAILSGGTDGEDGPTDAAGAVIDAETHRHIVQNNLDVQCVLETNDSYSLFKSVDGLIVTGPTGTNVCDVRVAVVHPSAQL